MSDNGHPDREDFRKKFMEVTAPLRHWFEDNADGIKFYYETSVDHWGRTKEILKKKRQTFESAYHDNMQVYHHYRRQFAWEIVAVGTTGIAMSSLFWGTQVTARNAILGAGLLTLAVNPEFVWDKHQRWMHPHTALSDTTNDKRTFV